MLLLLPKAILTHHKKLIQEIEKLEYVLSFDPAKLDLVEWLWYVPAFISVTPPY
jgi:hypothetical protein